MFGNRGWRIARVVGIEIRIDPSWVVIYLLVAYTFFFQLREEFVTAGAPGLAVLAGVVAAAFFFTVLVHELAHAFVARSKDIEVDNITLFLFGGATHARLDTESPGDEFQIAVVGPLTSVAIAGLIWIVVAFEPVPLSDEVAFIMGRLGWINLALGVFNLVPGFPLDGGRILRSIVWRRTGSLMRATRIAAQAGQGFGYVLVGLGVLEILAGALVGGLWLVAIGWFLSRAAQTSFAQVQIRKILDKVGPEQLMSRDLVHIDADTSLQSAVDEHFMRHDFNAFPVEAGGRIVGILTLHDVRRVPRDEWRSRTAADVMAEVSEFCTADVGEPMSAVLEKLETAESDRVLLLRDGEVAGLITPRDISRWLQRAQELGIESLETGRVETG